MTKITLNNVGSLIDATTAASTINSNFGIIEVALDNTLSRDGTTPNQMTSSLDMNSHQIINLPAPSTPNSVLRLQDLEDFVVTDGGAFLQPRSDILTSITTNGTNIGYLTVIGDGTVSPRTFTAASGLAVSNGNGVSGQTQYSIDVPTARTALSINNVDNTSDATKNAAAVTLTNKTLTAPVMTAPVLGTPASGVATNLTGTAAGLTAGNVTTNANLTGAITSVGNATSLGSFTSASLKTALTDETGSGVAVFATSPTLVTPVLGAATATTINGATLDNLAWTSYSPTITSAGGTFTGATITSSGRYKQIGKTIFLQADVLLTALGSGSPVGGLRMSLPFTAAAFNYSGTSTEIVTTGVLGRAIIVPSGTFVDTRKYDGTTYIVAGYQVIVGVTYEIP